jgi:hypothetical protein
MFDLVCEHTKNIGFTNVIDLIFNIFAIKIGTTKNMSIIHCCTSLQCQLKKRFLNDHSSKRNHNKHDWLNYLFNFHSVLSHHFITSIVALVLQMLGTKAMIQKLIWMISYKIPISWREYC